MNFMVRPSKSFLFDRLEKELGKTKTGVGLDAGSATFKNRPMFKTGTYIGLDIDKQRVETGLKRYPDSGPWDLSPISTISTVCHRIR